MEQIPDNNSEIMPRAVEFTDTAEIMEAVERAREQAPRGAVFDSERGDHVGVDQETPLEEVAILLDHMFEAEYEGSATDFTVSREGDIRTVTGHRSLEGGFWVAISRTVDTKTGRLTGLKVFTETDIAEQLDEQVA